MEQCVPLLGRNRLEGTGDLVKITKEAAGTGSHPSLAGPRPPNAVHVPWTLSSLPHASPHLCPIAGFFPVPWPGHDECGLLAAFRRQEAVLLSSCLAVSLYPSVTWAGKLDVLWVPLRLLVNPCVYVQTHTP